MNKLEDLNCRINENIQRIEYYKLTSKDNRKIALNMLNKRNEHLIKKIKTLKGGIKYGYKKFSNFD